MSLRGRIPPACLEDRRVSCDMNVLLVISSVEFGGAEQYLVELADELCRRGHQVVLVAPELVAEQFDDAVRRLGIALMTCAIEWAWGPEDGTGGSRYDTKVTRQRAALADILAVIPCDVAFVNANWPTHYAGAMQALCDADVKFGAHFHLCPHTIPLNQAARRIHAEVLPRASFLTTVSNATRFFAEQTFGRLLSFGVIANGGRFIVDPKSHEALATTVRQHILVSIGRLDHQKGYLDLVPAFNIPGALSRYELQILGDGPLGPMLRALISPDRKAVKFVGQVKDVEEYLRSADGFVLPSHFEGMSLAIIEAMSLGCIPIVSNASSAGELITEGENGFLFQVGSWRSFLMALDRFNRADKSALRWNCLRRSLLLSRSRMLSTMAEKISSFHPA
jgi:glycosyltransferase involved in cell wall biosynthesis